MVKNSKLDSHSKDVSFTPEGSALPNGTVTRPSCKPTVTARNHDAIKGEHTSIVTACFGFGLVEPCA